MKHITKFEIKIICLLILILIVGLITLLFINSNIAFIILLIISYFTIKYLVKDYVKNS